MKGSMGSGGFFKKTRSAKGSLGGAKGKGAKGKQGSVLSGSSFHTFKQSAPSTSTSITRKAKGKK